jgi:nudix-type nucleoside diphosphatase (YffH/AdpP family)
MSHSASVIVRAKRRLFDDFFKVDELMLSYRLSDGSMSPDRRFLVFERGDAVAALILNRDTGELILVEQFRAPTLEKTRTDGWMTEAVAGMIRLGETPEQAIEREVFEETGYKIKDPEPIITYFPSPGGTSERIFLFYAVVGNADRTGPGGGMRDLGEDTRVLTMPPEDLFDQIRRGFIEDSKLIIAAYHLKERVKIEAKRPKVLPPRTILFGATGQQDFKIGIKTGDILQHKHGVDVWVNSENTDMMMDRIIGKSVSASIRYAGAEKDGTGAVLVDTVANALRHKLNGRVYVKIGTVLETEAGALQSTHEVRRIIHVASVDGAGPGRGVRADPQTISDCVRAVLDYVHARNNRWWRLSGADRSILFPLLGAGDGGLSSGQVAPIILDAVLRFLDATPDTALREIYLLAYRDDDEAACMKALLGRPEKIQPL